MTQKQAIKTVHELGFRLRIVPEYREFQVIVVGKPEATYFTDDLDDAVNTAKEMAKRCAN